MPDMSTQKLALLTLHLWETRDNNNLRTRFNSVRRRYLNQLINNLHDRFPENDLGPVYMEVEDPG